MPGIALAAALPVAAAAALAAAVVAAAAAAQQRSAEVAPEWPQLPPLWLPKPWQAPAGILKCLS